MRKQRVNKQVRRVLEVSGEPCYAIAEAARVLARSRPTLMRWVVNLRRFTGYSALQDRAGRWYFPVAAVERLLVDQELMKRLAQASATNGHDKLTRVARDVSDLKKEVSRLRADVNDLKRRVKTA